MTITHLKKWGNSYGIRIPRDILQQTGIQPDTRIEIHEEQGSILLTPLTGPKWRLNDLLDRVTPENIHHEVDTWQPVGNEAW